MRSPLIATEASDVTRQECPCEIVLERVDRLHLLALPGEDEAEG